LEEVKIAKIKYYLVDFDTKYKFNQF